MNPAAAPAAVFLMGPTATGKTDLALTLAGRMSLEIVSVDSALVYRGMDIGTAKPSPEQRAHVPHHLIDIADPAERYSAARFAKDARRCIEEIHARGKVPLLVGGTMLYFRALDEGLSDLPAADPAQRRALESDLQSTGLAAMHERLRRLDPASAARIHPNDTQRILRALEVCALTGRPLSAQQGRRSGWAGRALRLALMPSDRPALHARIAARFERMMAEGFLDEVRALRARGDLSPDLPSMRAVGYRQAWEHLDGHTEVAEFHRRAVAATRQLAKRQMTWLRALQAEPVDPMAPGVDRMLESRVSRFMDTPETR